MKNRPCPIELVPIVYALLLSIAKALVYIWDTTVCELIDNVFGPGENLLYGAYQIKFPFPHLFEQTFRIFGGALRLRHADGLSTPWQPA
jgi:hypothetical protein